MSVDHGYAALDARLPRLPVCTVDEVREELAEAERDLARLAFVRPVAGAAARLEERRSTTRRWRDGLAAQLEEMTR